MELIRELRQDKNISRKELADAIGVTAKVIGCWERGEWHPSKSSMERLAKYFNVPIERFECSAESEGAVIESKRTTKAEPKITTGTSEANTPEDKPTQDSTPEAVEKVVNRAQFMRAAKQSMELIENLIGESKMAMMAAALLKSDIERRLW